MFAGIVAIFANCAKCYAIPQCATSHSVRGEIETVSWEKRAVTAIHTGKIEP